VPREDSVVSGGLASACSSDDDDEGEGGEAVADESGRTAGEEEGQEGAVADEGKEGLGAAITGKNGFAAIVQVLLLWGAPAAGVTACFRVFLSVRQDQKALKTIKNSIAISVLCCSRLQGWCGGQCKGREGPCLLPRATF
jgi:hypothetical protein